MTTVILFEISRRCYVYLWNTSETQHFPLNPSTQSLFRPCWEMLPLEGQLGGDQKGRKGLSGEGKREEGDEVSSHSHWPRKPPPLPAIVYSPQASWTWSSWKVTCLGSSHCQLVKSPTHFQWALGQTDSSSHALSPVSAISLIVQPRGCSLKRRPKAWPLASAGPPVRAKKGTPLPQPRAGKSLDWEAH